MVAERYRIEEALGKGGMGEVFRAYDTKVDQRVALKFLPQEVATHPEWMARTRQEVRLARSVAHPNVCRVYDLGESERGPFLSMEYVDGEDLSSLLRRVGRLAGEKAVDIARQVTAGLAAAHAANVLHRDLKPANIMLDSRGRAHIMDFGLAVAHEGDEARREVAGTPAYMAPEQAAAGIASVRSDLFSLGAVLYEIFTGRRPFAAKTLSDLVREQRTVHPPPPSSVARDLDPIIGAVIEQCMALEPGSRPSSALEVLAAFMGGDALGAAVAAGQTPSPQAVAASPTTGALKPAVAWACFAGIAACLAIYLLWGAALSVLERQAPEYPPQVLAEKARSALRELGEPGPWRSEIYGFAYNSPALPPLAREDLARPPARRPAAIVFWHRFDPEPVAPATGVVRVGARWPPQEPGSSLVILDCQGNLLSMLTVPASRGADAEAQDPDWPRAFRLAGVDPATLDPAGPWCCPEVFADATFSWKTKGGGPQEVRILAATLGSRPVSLQVQGPWTGGATVTAAGSGLPRLVGPMGAAALLALLVAVALAWSNLRQGRGDLKGALVLTTVSAGADLLHSLLVATHASDILIETEILDRAMSSALTYAGFVLIFYIALEPHVRRLWPESLVSWSRLLAGQWRVPMVARDVLLAMLLTMVTAALTVLGARAPGVAASFPGMPRWLSPLLGPRFLLAAFPGALSGAVYMALLSLVLLLIIRIVLRRSRLAAPALFVLLSVLLVMLLAGTERGPAAMAVAIALLVVAGWVILLTRFGLLAAAAGLFILLLANSLPDSTRFSPWYGYITWAIIAGVMLPALYGLVFSVGSERLFRFSMPERD
jgi:serine/threonine-protein kinase